jgi:prolyl 4-hydroxylase
MCREKWSSAKWVHVGRWATGAEARQRIEQTVHPIPSEKAQCADHNAWWDEWAMAGECSANPVWMVGDADKPGSCLLACRRCDVWLAHTAKHGQPPGGQLQQQHQQQAAVATQK